MVSQWYHLDTLPISINIHILGITITLLNTRGNILTFLTPNLLHTTHSPTPLIFKCGTSLLNTGLLFIHLCFNLPTILPSDHHPGTLTTSRLSLPILHTTNLLVIFPTLFVFKMLTCLLLKLHTINLMTKHLHSLHTCINLLTNILLFLHITHLPFLPDWVTIPTNILGTTTLPPSSLPSYLPFSLPTLLQTKHPLILSTISLSKLLFSLSTHMNLPPNQPGHFPLILPLLFTLIAH